MSVHSHFPHPPDTRMPRNPDGVDELGIRYEGPVLTGRLGVREAFNIQSAKLIGCRESNIPQFGPSPNIGPIAPAAPVDLTHVKPDDYDPVLRYHLRLPPK